MTRFKATFLEGLVFFIPAAFTGWVFYSIIMFLYNLVLTGTRFLPSYKTYPAVRVLVEGGAVIVSLLFIVLAGIIAETFIGKYVRGKIDSLLRAIPFVNALYDMLQQIFNILFLKSDQFLSNPVLVPFPHPGKTAVGFLTGRAEPDLAADKNREYVKVFLPTVPFPTTGFMMIFPRDEVVENVLTTEQALRLVLSGGLLNEYGGVSAPPRTPVRENTP